MSAGIGMNLSGKNGGRKIWRDVCGNNVPEQAIGSGASMKLEVECYSGFKADERPVRFRLDARPYLVEEVLDQWYGSQDVFYRIRADDGNLYILRHETSTPEGNWHLVSFRQMPPER